MWIVNTPIGKPIRKREEAPPLEVPESWPLSVPDPAPIRQPEKVPA